MRTTRSGFGELDDLVLSLKGLVLVRDLRKRGHADQEELALYSTEIQYVRDRLADVALETCTNGAPYASRAASSLHSEPSRQDVSTPDLRDRPRGEDRRTDLGRLAEPTGGPRGTCCPTRA
jgi:hypothetical protein